MTALSPPALDTAFPCRIAVDASLRLVSCGPGLDAPGAAVGASFDAAFRLIEPEIAADFDALAARSGTEVLIEPRLGGAALAGVLVFEKEAGVVHLLLRPAPRPGERDRASRVLLRELSRLRETDLDSLTRSILRADADALQIERVSYWSLRDDGAAIVCEALHLRTEDRVDKGVRLEAGDFPSYFAALHGREVVAAADAHTDPRTREFSASYLAPLGIGAMLDVPVFVGGDLVGVVCHEHVGGPREFSAYEQQVAMAVAQSLAQVLEADARRRAEAALRASEARFRRLVEISPVPLLVTAISDGQILYANDEVAKLLRTEREHILELRSVDFYKDPSERGRLIGKLLREGFLREEELRIARPDGTWFWAMLSVGPIVFDGVNALLCGLVDLSEHKRAHDQLRAVLGALERDIERARAFQENMRPPSIARADLGLEVVFQPADQVSGDMYDFDVLDDHVLRLFVADATGHGVSASLTTMFLRSEYDVASASERSPSAVLRALNSRLGRFLSRFAMRFTAVCATLDLLTGELRWASGGHPAPFVLRDGTVLELESGGPFLGLLPEVEFPEWATTLRPGDTLCLLSDGFTEALDARGKPIGERAVYQELEAAARAGRPIGAALLDAVRRLVGALQDDATLVAARWRPGR